LDFAAGLRLAGLRLAVAMRVKPFDVRARAPARS
jgi:hypothetical protein